VKSPVPSSSIDVTNSVDENTQCGDASSSSLPFKFIEKFAVISFEDMAEFDTFT